MSFRTDPYKKSRGVVLILALFITALVAAMVVAMMGRLQRDTYRTGLILHSIQAELYGEGAVAWAKDQLANNFLNKKPQRLVDLTPIHMPVKEMDGYRIECTISDAEAQFNLNNLVKPEDKADLKKLIKLVAPEINEQIAMGIVTAVTDWITPGLRNTSFDKYYLKLKPAYSAAHRPMFSISELRLIKGVNPELYKKLSLYVTALPEHTPVNIQSTSAPVLASLSPTMTLEAANRIVEYRKHASFSSVEKFLEYDVVKNNPIAGDKITVTSSYFLVTTTVTIGAEKYLLYTLLSRIVNNEKPELKIIWQSKGAP